jgi:chromosome segregation ATPase
MAKSISLPPIPGVRDLQTLMAFIMNKEEYDARLDAMVTLQEEIHTMLGKYSTVKDLDAHLSSAMQKDAEAAATLDAARTRAKAYEADILQAAKAEADAVKAKAEQVYQDTVAQMTQLLGDKEAFEQYRAEVEADLEQRLKACESREAESAKVKAEVDAMQEALATKLAKLKAATEGV